MAAPAQNGWIEWTPAGSNPGNGRGDPPPIPDQMNSERGHALIYTGGLKVSRYSLPEHNSKGYHSVPTPMLSSACKKHFNICSEFNHFLNHLRPFQFGQGLQATYLNSSTCVWIGPNGEKPTSERGNVQYAQGKGMLKTKAGQMLYEGDFDQGFRHGQGFALMEDLSFGFGTYQGAWVWGCRQGWGKFTLDSDGTVFEGNWKRDKLNGCVRVTQPDGGVYTGIYRDNARDGSGRYVWPIGQVEDHLYQRNALTSKVVYAVRPPAPAATAEGGAAPVEVSPSAVVPTLPFIEAFLAQKAAAPAAPVCSEPDDDVVMGEDGVPMKADGGIESLTGGVILADKILMRTVDEQYLPEISKQVSTSLGKEIAVKVDWESIKAGEQPRRGVFTMEKDRSAFVLQPLANIMQQMAADEMTKEALQGIATITLKQDSGATQSAVALDKDNLIISSNFEFGRGSTFQEGPLKKAIEKVL